MERHYSQKPTRSINLGPMFYEINDKKYVRFDSIPFGSFLNIKARGLGNRNEYYTDLL